MLTWYSPALTHLIVGFSRPVAEQGTVASLSNSMHCCGWGGGVNLSFSVSLEGRWWGRRGGIEAAREACFSLPFTPLPRWFRCFLAATSPHTSCMHANSPSTWTRAWASMLPAGVLLTQRYHVPSYTSTLLMRKVPFLETSNRGSCRTQT